VKLLKIFIATIALFFSYQAYAVDGIGLFCDLYDSALGQATNYTTWKFYGCNVVDYDDHGKAIAYYRKPTVDVVMQSCIYGKPSDINCDKVVPDKKQYPYYFAFSFYSGAASGGGVNLDDGVVLNSPGAPEGTVIGEITVCLKSDWYGLRACDKLPGFANKKLKLTFKQSPFTHFS
jgi:hypothetical protein